MYSGFDVFGLTMNTPGQIVRIKCKNVLTYKSIEIFPCSQLNLIIGANGSGKSTIISAIILGLGGNTQVVGRASELGKYVKVGFDKATIEIELYNPGGVNDVIRRDFDVRNHSKFWLNGNAVPVEKITKLVEKKYHIQINNLCQILPQEKLESFAKMNDQQRLQGTLKTIGEANLSTFFEELKDSKIKTQMVKKKIEDLKLELQQSIAKRDGMEAEARMIKEKQFLIECLKLLKQRRAWQFYFHMKQTINIIDDILASKQTVYKNVVIFLKRTLVSIETSNMKVYEMKNASKKSSDDLIAHVQTFKRKQNLISTSIEEINEMKANYENKIKRLQTQDAIIKELKANIEKLKTEIVRCSQVDDEIEDLKSRIQEEERSVGKVIQKKDMIRYEVNRKNSELNAIKFRLSRLTDTQALKMQLLERYYEDSFRALKWLDQNKHLFHGQVYGPMFLYLNVKQTENAKYVENCVGNRDLIAFICERREDTNILLRECKEKLNLRINVVSAVHITDKTKLRPYISIEQLRKYGFHSFVSDFIDGPEIIVEYLISTYRLNFVPVGDNRTFTMSESIPRDIRLYFTDELRISISIASLTGERIESSDVMREARFLKVNQPTGDFEELQEEKAKLEHMLRQAENEQRDLQQQATAGDNRLKEWKEKLRMLVNSKANERRLKDSLKDKQSELNRIENDFIDVELEKRRYRCQLKLMLAKVSNMFLEQGREFKQLFELFFQYQQSLLEAKQRERMHEKNVHIASQFVAQVKQEVSALRKLDFKKRKTMEVTENLHHYAMKCTGNIDPRTPQFKKRKIFFSLCDNILILHRLINKFQAKINCLGSSNNGLQIFMEYKKLVKEVDTLSKKIEKKEGNLAHYQEKVEDLKVRWLQDVNALISRINDNFQRFFESMNCAGEVSLYRGVDEEDFSQYGIHIKVKFREESDLQILNAQTQSGGERAVSVAIYLLSLQELTTVPFRCIDEINQGMDADNERRIFNLITQATEERCQTQYFLLTPKLLPRLRFTPHMKVFCPFNGVGSLPHDKISQKIEPRSSP